MKKRLLIKQRDSFDCGPTCLRIVAAYYGRRLHPDTVKQYIKTDYNGVTLDVMSNAAEQLGFKTMPVKIGLDMLTKKVPLPCIVHWRNSHYVVVYKTGRKIAVSDPAKGLIKYDKAQFTEGWLQGSASGEEGVALLMEPTARFYDSMIPEDSAGEKKISLRFFFNYLRTYKKYFVHLFIGMLIASILQLIFPVITQSIVDKGIADQNIGFVNLMLIAQLMLFFSKSAIDFVRNWIFLYMTSRLNISVLSDFLNKLMRLRISFFDGKMIGDLMQRIGDHNRVRSFVSSSTLSSFFLLLNLVIYSILLGLYNLRILLVFFSGSLLYFAWILLFLKRRKKLDNDFFMRNSKNQTLLIQLISGMRDIKLNNAEKQKRMEWETAQVQSYRLGVRQMRLAQTQQSGALVIDQLKNILVSYLSAKAVIDGDMTLGMMLSVQYMLGQLGVPINQIMSLFNSYQDAKLSLERIGEVHEQEEEHSDNSAQYIPAETGIKFKDVSFQYQGSERYALQHINCSIPQGKVTAIVGMSGSGKTTLLKLLLQFYEVKRGDISIGDVSLNNIDVKWWRERCGTVMQDSFIFSDTILNNITFGKEIDPDRFKTALDVSNIREFVEPLPQGLHTKLGPDGLGISHGQKQRILIARAVYKAPEFLFLDEATNALDTRNERVIMDRLNTFFRDRTVVIVAHRLSTVMNADQILVVDKGRIVESGNHERLVANRGQYFELVKNQIELNV